MSPCSVSSVGWLTTCHMAQNNVFWHMHQDIKQHVIKIKTFSLTLMLSIKFLYRIYNIKRSEMFAAWASAKIRYLKLFRGSAKLWIIQHLLFATLDSTSLLFVLKRFMYLNSVFLAKTVLTLSRPPTKNYLSTRILFRLVLWECNKNVFIYACDVHPKLLK